MNIINISNTPITMSSREIAELTGKEHKNVMADIRKMLDELGKTSAEFSAVYKDQQLIDRPCFNLPKRETLILVSGYSVQMRATIIDRWQELEQGAKPLVPQTLHEALRLAADLAEQKAAAEQERDIALATKALIGNKREATAMATASVAVRKASKLEIELDKAKQYATIKRMEMLYHGQKFSWRLLKSTATEMGVPSIDVFDANYGTVKAYHADVWRETYALEIVDGDE